MGCSLQPCAKSRRSIARHFHQSMACYYKANTKSSKSVPCDHNALANGGHTQCCEPGDLCLTNGLCREETVDNVTNYAWRFGCTDPNFKDPACGTQYCDFIKGIYRAMALPGQSLNVDIDSDTHLTWKCHEDKIWCCNTGFVQPFESRANRSNTTCCSDTALLFTAENPEVFTTASPLNSMFSIGTIMPGSTASSNMTASSASVTATSASAGLSSATAGVAAPSSGTSTLAIGLGAGIGSAAAIGLGILTFSLLRRRRTKSSDAPGSESVAEELGSEDVVEGHNEHIVEMTAQDHKAELASPDSPVELWSPVVSAELPCEEKGRCAVNELDSTPKR